MFRLRRAIHGFCSTVGAIDHRLVSVTANIHVPVHDIVLTFRQLNSQSAGDACGAAFA